MSIVRAIYDEVESPVLKMMKELDRKRAERVIGAYYDKEIKKGSAIGRNYLKIKNLRNEINELKKEKAQLLQQLSLSE